MLTVKDGKLVIIDGKLATDCCCAPGTCTRLKCATLTFSDAHSNRSALCCKCGSLPTTLVVIQDPLTPDRYFAPLCTNTNLCDVCGAKEIVIGMPPGTSIADPIDVTDIKVGIRVAVPIVAANEGSGAGWEPGIADEFYVVYTYSGPLSGEVSCATFFSTTHTFTIDPQESRDTDIAIFGGDGAYGPFSNGTHPFCACDWPESVTVAFEAYTLCQNIITEIFDVECFNDGRECTACTDPIAPAVLTSISVDVPAFVSGGPCSGSGTCSGYAQTVVLEPGTSFSNTASGNACFMSPLQVVADYTAGLIAFSVDAGFAGVGSIMYSFTPVCGSAGTFSLVGTLVPGSTFPTTDCTFSPPATINFSATLEGVVPMPCRFIDTADTNLCLPCATCDVELPDEITATLDFTIPLEPTGCVYYNSCDRPYPANFIGGDFPQMRDIVIDFPAFCVRSGAGSEPLRGCACDSFVGPLSMPGIGATEYEGARKILWCKGGCPTAENEGGIDDPDTRGPFNSQFYSTYSYMEIDYYAGGSGDPFNGFVSRLTLDLWPGFTYEFLDYVTPFDLCAVTSISLPYIGAAPDLQFGDCLCTPPASVDVSWTSNPTTAGGCLPGYTVVLKRSANAGVDEDPSIFIYDDTEIPGCRYYYHRDLPASNLPGVGCEAVMRSIVARLSCSGAGLRADIEFNAGYDNSEVTFATVDMPLAGSDIECPEPLSLAVIDSIIIPIPDHPRGGAPCGYTGSSITLSW